MTNLESWVSASEIRSIARPAGTAIMDRTRTVA